METLTIKTGTMVVTADKTDEYGLDWATKQLENIASFSKEFIAAARGKVFLTVNETHTQEEFEEIVKELGFKKSQAYNYVDYARKEGMIAHVKSIGFQNKLPLNAVNALPEDKDAAVEVLKEANTIANGKTVTAEVIEKAKKNLDLGDGGSKKVDLSKIMDKGAKMKEWLLDEKDWTIDEIRDNSDLDGSPKRVFLNKIEMAIDDNFPNWADFVKVVEGVVTGKEAVLLREMDNAVDFYYAYKAHEIKHEDLEADKQEFNALFFADKIK